MFRIQETKDHGKAVVATERLEPGPFGLSIFREEALIIIPTRGTELDKSGPCPAILEPGPQMWTDWWTYLQQPEDIKKRLLSMYIEMDCAPALALRNYLFEKDLERQEEKVEDEDFDMHILDNIEEFIKFAMVIRFNTVELCPPNAEGTGPGTDYGHGIFEIACKMNHSCKPNCIWITTQDGKAKEIRAISTIEKGEELTIDYVGNTLEPIPQRRQELLMTKGFICNCDRCAASHDVGRRFPCSNSKCNGCSGVHFLVQPLLSSVPELLDCTKCGAQAPDEYLTNVVEQELELVKEINELGAEEAESFMTIMSDRIERLEPPHQLHCLADKCYELKGEFYSTRGEYRSAADAYMKQLQCRNAILGKDFNSQITAFCCERLGDALRHFNVEAAEEAYKTTVRILQKMRGGVNDPYSKCALIKLLEVQNRRAHDNLTALPSSTCLETIGEGPGCPPTTEYPCELCGNPSKTFCCGLNYCCEDHRKMHLPVIHDQFTSEETKLAV